LKKVVRLLDTIGIEYMISGSIAASLQGEPRSTHDLDFVVDLQKSQLTQFVRSFDLPEFYVDEDSIRDALNNKSMFNIVDSTGGDRIDFWILTEAPFDASRFSRRICEDFMGIELKVSSPEDTILMKLRWAMLSGGSEKQFIDALRAYEVQFENLDLDYLEHWTKKLTVESLWRRVKEEAEAV